MAGFNPDRQFSHARAILKMDGEIIGAATDASGGETVDYAAHHPMGQVNIAGHTANETIVTFDCTIDTQVAGQLEDLGLLPGRPGDYITAPPITVEIEDNITNETMWLIRGVKKAGRTWDIARGAPVQNRYSFVATIMEGTNQLSS